jgi:hypothetical protein
MINHDQAVPSQIVERPGVSLLKAGEQIVAANDAVALLRPAAATTVNYYFPIEIEVLGASAAKAIADEFEALHRNINATA